MTIPMNQGYLNHPSPKMHKVVNFLPYLEQTEQNSIFWNVFHRIVLSKQEYKLIENDYTHFNNVSANLTKQKIIHVTSMILYFICEYKSNKSKLLELSVLLFQFHDISRSFRCIIMDDIYNWWVVSNGTNLTLFMNLYFSEKKRTVWFCFK